MIDLHAHFLPAMDDGAGTIRESMRMLEDSFLQGVFICAATPHCVVHHADDILMFLKKRQSCIRTLNEALAASTKTVPQIVLGAEVYLDHDISGYAGLEQLCLGDSPYMLVEFSHSKKSKDLPEWLYSLSLKGIKPIVAHIDRYEDREVLIQAFSGLGVVYQINASSMLTFGGRRFTAQLLRITNRVIVSSDMHNLSSRPCNMQDAYCKARRFGERVREELFLHNATQILGVERK